MKTAYVCGNCRERVSARAAKAGPCPFCFTPDIRLEEEEDPSPGRSSTATITRLDDVHELELLPCKAPLLACLGGVEERALIVVSGEPGEGKSTECARVAVELDEPPAYLDAEMSPERMLVVLKDAGASAAFIRRTARIVGEDWRDALKLAESRSLWLIDSATEWCPQEDEKEFAAALVNAAAEGRIILAIQQWSQKARARGSLKLSHRGDVTIEVMEKTFEVKKARWGQKGSYPRPRIVTARMKRSSVAATGSAPRR